jgi:spore coat protein U-like protein
MAKYISRAAIAAALALGVSGANASQWGTAKLEVSVNVVNSCNIASVAPIEFTQINSGAPTTEDIKSSAIVVNCNSGGWHLSPVEDVPNDVRSLKNGLATLNYKLCNPSPVTYASCNPFNQGNQISGSALSDTKTVYAVMEGGNTPTKSGNYADTVTIQLTN